MHNVLRACTYICTISYPILDSVHIYVYHIISVPHTMTIVSCVRVHMYVWYVWTLAIDHCKYGLWWPYRISSMSYVCMCIMGYSYLPVHTCGLEKRLTEVLWAHTHSLIGTHNILHAELTYNTICVIMGAHTYMYILCNLMCNSIHLGPVIYYALWIM